MSSLENEFAPIVVGLHNELHLALPPQSPLIKGGRRFGDVYLSLAREDWVGEVQDVMAIFFMTIMTIVP
jgi:hypothetical protein